MFTFTLSSNLQIFLFKKKMSLRKSNAEGQGTRCVGTDNVNKIGSCGNYYDEKVPLPHSEWVKPLFVFQTVKKWSVVSVNFSSYNNETIFPFFVWTLWYLSDYLVVIIGSRLKCETSDQLPTTGRSFHRKTFWKKEKTLLDEPPNTSRQQWVHSHIFFSRLTFRLLLRSVFSVTDNSIQLCIDMNFER